jgi:hypothetical protein
VAVVVAAAVGGSVVAALAIWCRFYFQCLTMTHSEFPILLV